MRTRDTDKERLVKQKAIELIVQDGLEKFSVNKLAKACGISVATLYIYYKDKEDLIIRIAQEEGKRMAQAMIKGFDPDVSFEEGLKVQWKNRYNYMMKNRQLSRFFELLRSSNYQEPFLGSFMEDFKVSISRFMDNVVSRGEIDRMPLEVYWSIAFAPLYALIRFSNEGKGLGGKPFKMTDKALWLSFDYVVKALKK